MLHFSMFAAAEQSLQSWRSKEGKPGIATEQAVQVRKGRSKIESEGRRTPRRHVADSQGGEPSIQARPTGSKHDVGSLHKIEDQGENGNLGRNWNAQMKMPHKTASWAGVQGRGRIGAKQNGVRAKRGEKEAIALSQ